MLKRETEDMGGFPSTRYQGSKRKLLSWIRENVVSLEFCTALDVFGGTGCVSYLLKSLGKAVTYNDYLRFNCLIGTALIENSEMQLSEDDINFVLCRDPQVKYDDVIARTFHDIYFPDEENVWLDTICQNIPRLQDKYKRALAYYALFQSCIIKRPYNLFHRKNLYMRTANVERSFGNKTTWEVPFEEHFRRFVTEANQAIFDTGIKCRAISYDALVVPEPHKYDLVYIDPPYINQKGIGVDYLGFYHFLEGLVDYPHWKEEIDYRKKHHPLKGTRSAWSNPKCNRRAFESLLQRYSNSILVVSYRSDGVPSEQELFELLSRIKRNVKTLHFGEYKYALSTNGSSQELLFVGY